MTQITNLLRSIDQGDESAKSELFNRIYSKLRGMARERLSTESPDHTLQPTALVHEVYLRMFRSSVDAVNSTKEWTGSRHFYGAVANAMRQILVETARRKKRKKHGGDFSRILLDINSLGREETAEELLALHESLNRFEKVEPKIAELVRLRFFAGLTIKQAAQQIGIAPRTADDHWAYAKAWLLADMQDENEDLGLDLKSEDD